MNHECMKDLSMKISIEFKDQVSRFLSKGYSEKLNFDPGWGGGGGGGLLLKSKRIFSLCLHLVIIEQLWALNLYKHLPYQSMQLL